MMKFKRTLALILSLLMIASVFPSLAEEVSEEEENIEITLDPNEKRGIKVKNPGLNDEIEGISPTTGRTLSEIEVPEGFGGLASTGRYMPMIVQISNQDGGVDKRAPWGLSYADIIYETPLYRNGITRLSALFSDVLPDSVGPIRSARIGHVWLRQEWDCGFMYFGQQTHKGANVQEEFKKLGATKTGVLFSGIVGESKPWMKYYTKRAKTAAPNDKSGNVTAMCDLIPEEHQAKSHAFLFTDELPVMGSDATEIDITWGEKLYNSHLVYSADTNDYTRYMHEEHGDDLVMWVDRDTEEPITFNNVIVQFCNTKFLAANVPVCNVVSEGNADYFMGGKHIAGYWKRDDMESRTVYYDPDGKEIELQRGRTLIVQIPDDDTRKVTFVTE